MEILQQQDIDGSRVEVFNEAISVSYRYPVYFCRDIFAPAQGLLATLLTDSQPGRPARALAYVDEGLAAATPGLLARIVAYFDAHAARCVLARPPALVPGGEVTKTAWTSVQQILSDAGSAHLCRHSYVLAVGGGSALDMIGFSASLIHRGVRVLRVPTTVLAQCDAGIGVKTGMNAQGMKNFAGTFAPPHAVLNDFDFLKTLPDTHWTGGVAEAFKVAIIKDAGFFGDLCRNARALARRDEGAMADAIKRAAVLHLDHIRTGGDPFEFGAARPLDFGHWAAHRLEVLSHFTFGHGQAVAVGIALDSCYAARQGLISRDERDAILAGLRACGLPVWTPLLLTGLTPGRPEVLRGIDEFREHLGGVLTVTLPLGIGCKTEVHEMDESVVLRALDDLRTVAAES